MNLNEAGFRAVYHRLVAIKLDPSHRSFMRGFPEASKATYGLFYGYIDSDKGLMLELLAGGRKGRKYFNFYDTNPDKRARQAAKKLAEAEIFDMNDDAQLAQRYAVKIQALAPYEASAELEAIRGNTVLDPCRDPFRPDEVSVRLVKKGLKPEDCRVRITGLEGDDLTGLVTKAPRQDFGLAKGDPLTFRVTVGEDGAALCLRSFDGDGRGEATGSETGDATGGEAGGENGGRNGSKAEREDADLKAAIAAFYKSDSEEAQIRLLNQLNATKFYTPGHQVLTQEAQDLLNQYKAKGKGLDDMSQEDRAKFEAGSAYSPNMVENKENHHIWMALMSGPEELGKDQGPTYMLPTSFMNALEFVLAWTEQGKKLDEVVVNPYTDHLTITREWIEAQFASGDPANGGDHPSAGGVESFNPSDLPITLTADKMNVFNFALYQNGFAPVSGLRILNETGDPLRGLTLRITSDFDFFQPYQMPLPDIPSGDKWVKIDDPQLQIRVKDLAEMNEAVDTTVTVEVLADNQIICGCRDRMRILAYDQWMGGDYLGYLPAFVMPNHPVIAGLLHDAAEVLQAWGKEPVLDAYQKKNPNLVRDQAAAVYAAIQKKNIVYAQSPASFSVPGQRIRTPESIMDQHLGTCMDMTLLYAACLEQIGLEPLLVLKQGHIFAGIWLRERSFEEIQASNVAINALEELTKRFGNGADELTFVECTKMCAGGSDSFEQAEAHAKLYNLDPATFWCAIDVRVARLLGGVVPMACRVSQNGAYQIDFQDRDHVTDPPRPLHISVTDLDLTTAPKPMTKRDLWESKLLDLSPHNMLIDLPRNDSLAPIMSSHIDQLEDALADGHEFRLLPAPDWVTDIVIGEYDGSGKVVRQFKWLAEQIDWNEKNGKNGFFEITNWRMTKDYDVTDKFFQEFRNHRLYTFSKSSKKLNKIMTDIYRAARDSQQENGVSSLYLAIGLLRWMDPEIETQPHYAPLILLPVEMVRKSASLGYALHARDEDPHFNTTLLEMLRQKFNMEIGGLDPLPADEHGVNIPEVFSIVRSAVYSLPNWDVVESCALGNFSFAQFAMWNDIHTAGPVLEASDLVRSLMKGYVDWDAAQLDQDQPDGTYLPISVDATQLKAIQMASQGATFILHGPPGTGKSQTITAMIANLMAQGKRVLFVAEKMAALSVVQKRLRDLGISDFCLELHSDKASKSRVLAQLDKALAAKKGQRAADYENDLKLAALSREKLDRYGAHLYKMHPCGFSLRGLIDRYEAVGPVDHPVAFAPDQVRDLSQEVISRHVNALDRLTAAAVLLPDLTAGPLASLGLADYNAEARRQVKPLTQAYRTALEALQTAGGALTQALGLDPMPTPQEPQDLTLALDIYGQVKAADPFLREATNLTSPALEAVYDLQDQAALKDQAALAVWKPEFLETDPAQWQEKHAAAGRKFFGKASAMAAVTAELQTYALVPLTYEAIPDLLDQAAQAIQARADLWAGLDGLSAEDKARLERLPDRASFAEAQAAAQALADQAQAYPTGPAALDQAMADPETDDLIQAYRASRLAYDQAAAAFNSLMDRDGETAAGRTFAQDLDLCTYLQDHPAALKDRAIYNGARKTCLDLGLAPAVAAFEAGLPATDLVPAYKKGFYYALITDIIGSDDVLSMFSGAAFNEAVRQFKILDDRLLDLTKKEIYCRLADNIPSALEGPAVGGELTLLRKAIGNKARGLSIRALFDKIPHLLPRLVPCMLMSPNSVAQYLAQDNDLFDVVIFDEASQLPTCKAVGAIMRGRHAVIVGDPKQMPPTSFFAGTDQVTEDFALSDLDSILDDALALGIPSQYLQWHYRSRHESLIAFSNSEFYDNKMFTFPAANDRKQYVTACYVADGVYKKGINAKEAEAVVADIIRRYQDPALRDQSVGVVTFNVKQQALIEDLLAKQYEKDPGLDAWAHNSDKGHDPLFVKNLENVQGDERDVILFSIGYGPDEKKNISMNFGPINKEGGGKRLNVAFSRSRQEMKIFTSMHASDIRITDSSREGIMAFRDFLRFAEGLGLEHAGQGPGQTQAPQTGMVQALCQALTDKGWQCETMVGRSDFHVDIAVVDPAQPDRYLLGILLDGDTYRRTAYTRDREIAQEGVLGGLGWNLRRIWTVDWWDNRAKVLDSLTAQLDQLKQAAQAQADQAAQAADRTPDADQAAKEEELRAQLAAQALELEKEQEDEDSREPGAIEPEWTGEREPADQAAPVEIVPTAQPQETSAEAASDGSEVPQSSSSAPAQLQANEEGPAWPAEAEEGPAPTASIATEGTTEEDPAEAKSVDQPQADPASAEACFARLAAAGADWIDKRPQGGALWVVGGQTLAPIMEDLQALGVAFSFKPGGGRTTDGRDAWWTKADVALPPGPAAGQPLQAAPQDACASALQDQAEEQAEAFALQEAGGLAAKPAQAPDEAAAASQIRPQAQPSQTGAPANEIAAAPSAPGRRYSLADWTPADVQVQPLDPAAFADPASKAVIGDAACAIVRDEGPILKDVLIKRLLASFGVTKSAAATAAADKAIRAAGITTSRLKGTLICWAPGQDPKTYCQVRTAGDRTADEWPLPEVKNALCWALQEAGPLDKADLIKQASRIMGYKRLGKNLDAVLQQGLQYARTCKEIRQERNGLCSLRDQDDQ